MSRHRLLPATWVILCLVWLLALGACGKKGGSSASAAAVQTTPRFVYVANNSDNTISVYTENTASGQLQANNNYYYFVAAGMNPLSVTVDPTGQFAYVANFGSHSVSAYGIDSGTGALTAVGAAVATGTNPQSVTVDPTGQFAYVANYTSSDISAYRINPSTGALTPVVCSGGSSCNGNNFVSGTNPVSVAIDPAGKFAYVANYTSSDVSIYSINPGTGVLTAVGTMATGLNPSSVSINPAFEFAYVTNYNSNDVSVYRIDAITGMLTQINCGGGAGCNADNFVAGTNPVSVAIDPAGKFAYVANIGSNNVSAYLIDPATGVLTSVGKITTGLNPSSVAINPAYSILYVTNEGSNNVSAYLINPVTGVLTALRAAATGTTPTSVAVDLTGKFVFVTNSISNDISAYRIANDGGLARADLPATGTSPTYLSADPAGQFAYATNYGSNDVSAYRINPSTGVLTPVVCSGGAGCNGNNFVAGTNPVSVAVDPTGAFAYVANYTSSDVSIYSINPSTGALTQINCGGGAGCNGNNFVAGTNPQAVTVDPTGAFAYVANVISNDVTAFRINPGTGTLTAVGTAATGTNPIAVTIEPMGNFIYAANSTSNDVSAYRIDPGTGALTQIDCGGGAGCSGNNFVAGLSPSSITVDPTGRFVYVANRFANNVAAYSIDASTGALVQIMCNVGCSGNNYFAAGTNPISITIDPAGTFAFVVNKGSSSVSVYSINAGTGVLTAVGAVSSGANPSSVISVGAAH